MTPDTDATHRTHFQAGADDISVRELSDDEADDGTFRIRMPVSSTAEARDGEAFSRERLAGFREQIETGEVGVFLDHGRSGIGGSRYAAMGKVGRWETPELVDRSYGADLVADAVLLDPDETDRDLGAAGDALRMLRAQAEAGIPLASSVGWDDDIGDRDVPGDADLLEISIVGIPSDPQTTTASAGHEQAMARAAAVAGGPAFDPETFVDAYRSALADVDATARELPEVVVEELGDLLTPNAGAVNAAQQALDWAEEHPEEFALGSEDGEGLRRARQLVDHDGERLTGTNEDGNSYWTEIEGFHSRHHAQGNHELAEEFEGEPWRDAGYVAHLAWGGDEGYEQAQRVDRALEALADDEDVDFDRAAITAATVKDASPVAVDGGAEDVTGDGDRNLDDPAFAPGDAVMWSWDDEPVHGRVDEVVEQMTPPEADEPITGEDGEAVYAIYEWDGEAEVFDHVNGEPNVAKPQSSLDESTADLPAVSDDTLRMSDTDESDAQSDTDRDEQPDLRDMEEKMEEVREHCRALREMQEEMYEEMMGGPHDGDEEAAGSEDDAEDDADDESEPDEEAGAERTVTLDGEERTVSEAVQHLRTQLEATDATDLESKTVDRAPDEAAVETDDTDTDTDDDTTFGF